MFDYLKPYIVEQEFEDNGKEHVFYRVKNTEIIESENRMDIKFPPELTSFFLEIGYGYFYDKDDCFIDVLMKPSAIADYRCGEGMYQYSEDRDFLEKNTLVFFEVDSNCHIHIKTEGAHKGEIFFGKRTKFLSC